MADETTHLPRIFVDAPSLAENGLVSLSPFQSNYLNVMRISNTKRWGQWASHVRIFNGKNGEWLAKMAVETSSSSSSSNSNNSRRRRRSSDVDNTILECLKQTKDQPSQDGSAVHLHMGRLKKQRRKWVLEKVTELGISSIDMVDTEFSSVTDVYEYEKHISQVIEAAEQCERLTIPNLSQTPTAWSDLVEMMEEEDDDTEDGSRRHWLICRERSPNLTLPILSTLDRINKDSCSNVHILVGPEGGWSPMELDEMSKLQETKQNVHFVSLGPLVLRAETAAIAAITATILSQDQS